MDPSEALRRTMARQDLSRGATEELFGSLMDGGWTEAQKAALLVALALILPGARNPLKAMFARGGAK